MKFIPNLITLLNLAFGVLGIILATREAMVSAAYCMFIAGILDFLDGFVARMLNVSSDIGKQLDSLADMVTFGTLPGVIMFQFIAINRGIYFDDIMHWGLTDILHCSVALIIPMAGAYRLAMFNNEESKHYFMGMPTPAVALLVCSFPLILESQFHLNFYALNKAQIFGTVAELQHWEWLQIAVAKALLSQTFIQVLCVVLAIMMVMRVPMIALKFRGLSWAKNKWIYSILIWLVIVWVIFVIPYVIWIPFDYANVDFISFPIAWLGYVVLSILYATFANRNNPEIDIQ